jgi:hypothetical protein
MNRKLLAPCAGLVLVLAVWPGAGRAQEATFDWRGRIPQGETVEIKNISGDIHAVLASGTEVEVVATKRGKREDFAEVDIEVVEEDGRTVICAIYGSWNHDRGTCDHQKWDDDER